MEIILFIFALLVVFWIVKSIVQSVVKGIFFSIVFIAVAAFILLVYMFGVEGAISAVRSFVNL